MDTALENWRASYDSAVGPTDEDLALYYRAASVLSEIPITSQLLYNLSLLNGVLSKHGRFLGKFGIHVKYDYKLELLLCGDNQDDVFEHFLSNYNYHDLSTLVQNGWPTSHYLRRRILQLCFENNISHLIARPLKIIAHCLSKLCAYNKGTEMNYFDICVNVIDEIDGDTHRVCNVNMPSIHLFDIAPVFLQQIMEDDDMVIILPSLAKYPSCTAECVDLFFTPSVSVKKIIIQNSDVLQTLIPLVFPIVDDGATWSMVVERWFTRQINTQTAFLFAYNGGKTRELTYPTDPSLLLDAVLSYNPRSAVVSATLHILFEYVSPGTVAFDKALARKEEMLAELSMFLPDGSAWRNPLACCVCYELHFGCLQQCRHAVCYRCYDRIEAGTHIVCPYCRAINRGYEFADIKKL